MESGPAVCTPLTLHIPLRANSSIRAWFLISLLPCPQGGVSVLIPYWNNWTDHVLPQGEQEKAVDLRMRAFPHEYWSKLAALDQRHHGVPSGAVSTLVPRLKT